jgi:hypothetical protein
MLDDPISKHDAAMPLAEERIGVWACRRCYIARNAQFLQTSGGLTCWTMLSPNKTPPCR